MQNQPIQMYEQRAMRINTMRNKGWLLMLFGILSTMWGLCWLFLGVGGYFDPSEGIPPLRELLPGLGVGLLSVSIGLFSLRFGIKRVKYANDLADTGDRVYYGPKHQKMAWSFTIVGGFLSLVGLLFGAVAIDYLVIIPDAPDAMGTVSISLPCIFLGLLCGLPFLLLGTLIIANGRKVKRYENQ